MNARLPSPYRDEAPIVQALLQSLSGRLDWPSVVVAATSWVQGVRDTPAPFWALESLLREYPISSAEGLALMLSLIHISEPTRHLRISFAVFCL